MKIICFFSLENYYLGMCFPLGSNYCGCSNNMIGVSHHETLTVSLTSERGVGYGLAVTVEDHVENRTADILVSRIVPDSPAYRFVFYISHIT